ncbi:hypothetical protein ACRAWF_27015 [Streptomyces sp. L7]
MPEQLRSMASDGIVTVKMFTTYRGETMADEKTILNVMTTLRDLGGMVVIHCEADHIIADTQERGEAAGAISAGHHAGTRPELAENASVAEILAIAESVSAPVYFVHQSTPEAVDLVARARGRGCAPSPRPSPTISSWTTRRTRARIPNVASCAARRCRDAGTVAPDCAHGCSWARSRRSAATTAATTRPRRSR